MARKARMTGFSRFLLVMVIILPLAFMGANYYNGEDGFEKLKELVGLNNSNTSTAIDDLNEQVETTMPTNNTSNEAPTTKVEAVSPEVIDSRIERLNLDLAAKNAMIDSLLLKNKTLQASFDGQQEKIDNLQKQLDNIKSAIGQ